MPNYRTPSGGNWEVRQGYDPGYVINVGTSGVLNLSDGEAAMSLTTGEVIGPGAANPNYMLAERGEQPTTIGSTLNAGYVYPMEYNSASISGSYVYPSLEEQNQKIIKLEETIKELKSTVDFLVETLDGMGAIR